MPWPSRAGDTNFVARFLFAIAFACSVAAAYLAFAGSDPNGPVTNPDTYYGSLPHAFPGAG
jgi:hypothetical protein